METIIQKAVQKGAELNRAVRKQTAGYITAGLGVVAGLAWNDAIRTLIETVFPKDSSGGVIAKFVYAALMTLVVVFISLFILRYLGDHDQP